MMAPVKVRINMSDQDQYPPKLISELFAAATVDYILFILKTFFQLFLLRR
jgi:hypothetical protein